MESAICRSAARRAYRYDYFHNYDFGCQAGRDGFDLLRFLVHVDAHFGEHVRAFVQFDSSLLFDRWAAPGREIPRTSTFSRRLSI